MSKSRSNSMNLSNTELRSDDLSHHTPIKKQSNENKYSNIYSKKSMTPQSTSSIHKYRSTLHRADHQTAELMISAKLASDKNRDILYTCTMKPLSPNSYRSLREQQLNNCYPSEETDTSSIKGFESHVIRMRTPPRKKDSIQSPSSDFIISPKGPNLTPSRQEKEKLCNEIDEFLEKYENDESI